MSHEDSPTGQQFHVRYDYTYANGTTHTLWGLVHTTRELAEIERGRHLKAGYPAEIFVRDLSPWRQDVPGACRCGHGSEPHRAIAETADMCTSCDDCWGYRP